MPHIKVKFCSTNYYSLKLLLQPFSLPTKSYIVLLSLTSIAPLKIFRSIIVTMLILQVSAQSQPVSSKNFCIIFINEFAPDRPSHLFLNWLREMKCNVKFTFKKRKNRIFSACIDFLHRVKTILCIHKSTESKNNLNLILWAMDKRCYDCRQKPKQSKSI